MNRLCLAREGESPRGFGKHRPLRNSHLRMILRRAGPHLRGFDLSGVVHLLDDKALAVIASNCPQLKELDISGLSAGWEALSELSEGLRHLEKLCYRDMINIGDKVEPFRSKAIISSSLFGISFAAVASPWFLWIFEARQDFVAGVSSC